MKFTTEEVALCKKIAEKYRKDLKIGMYVYQKFDKSIRQIYSLNKEEKEIYTVILKTGRLDSLYWNNLEGGWLAPLWQISDCLEFYEDNEATVERAYQLGGIFHVSVISWKGTFKGEGNSLREACLKAVLVILES